MYGYSAYGRIFFFSSFKPTFLMYEESPMSIQEHSHMKEEGFRKNLWKTKEQTCP